MKKDDEILRFAALRKKIGLSRSTVDRLEKKKNFPARIQLSTHAVGWSRIAIEQWLTERISSSCRGE